MAKANSPIIIRRVQGGDPPARHGGAWKVAYADFVTAMMAFFLLMWLLNATTEKQRQGLADFFNPTIIHSPTGGAEGVAGGRTAQPTSGASLAGPTPDRSDFEKLARQVQDHLTGSGAESMQRVNLLRHVVTRMTDEGLVIELSDIVHEPLFDGDTAAPTPALTELSGILATVLGRVRNPLAIAGDVRAFPHALAQNPAWPLSDARAHAVRGLLTDAGMAPRRIQRVTAWADSRARNVDPADPANNRIEVILLR